MTTDPANNSTSADRLHSRQVDLILDQLESLPTLPEVATQLLNLTASTRSDAQQVIALIKADQSLTARILSLAARADAGLRKEARTIDKAVLMLGFETVRSTVMSIKVFEMFGPSDAPVAGLDRREFWKHCLAAACAAELLATRTRPDGDPEELFVCGLLHDIGKLGLEQCLPKSYTRIVDTCNSQFGDIAQMERRIIGVDHTVAGRRLAQQWNLPAMVENVIWLHHQPIDALPASLEGRFAVGLVQLADTIVREQRFGYSGNFTFPADSARLASQLNIPAATIAETIEKLPATIERRAKMMGMGETTSESLFRSALASANEELGRLNRSFRRRALLAGAQMRGLKMLAEFTQNLSAGQSLGQLCRAIADAWAQATGAGDDSTATVGAYVLSRSDDTAVVGRCPASDPEATTLIPTRRDLPSITVPGSGVAAGSAVARFAAAGAAIPDWIAQPSMTHRPLICGDRWVGGLLYPSATAQASLPADTLEALAASMALAAAMTETRDRGAAMAEQLAQASQKLYAAQKTLTETRALATVGEMAAGAAHEINNPLAVIAGRAQLMAESADTPDQQTWRTMARQAQRISDIVSEMMEFAKPSEPKPEPIGAADVIAAAEEKLRQTPETPAATVMVEVAPDTPELFVDAGHITTVLAELLTNARDASENDKPVRVEAERDGVAGDVLLRVIDQGRGMSPETVDHAFTPFFSALPAGRKRGMGLSRARRLVELAGGKIWIQSAASEGTTVFVLVPAAKEAASHLPGEAH